MTAIGVHGMAAIRQTLPRHRLGAFLRSRYGHSAYGRHQHLARELGVTDRTARNLFEDHWPGDETWAAIVRRFGNDVLRAVFAPEIEPILAELTEKEARLAQELESLQARRREVQGDRRSFAEFVAADQAEADELDAAQLRLFEGPAQ